MDHDGKLRGHGRGERVDGDARQRRHFLRRLEVFPRCLLRRRFALSLRHAD